VDAPQKLSGRYLLDGEVGRGSMATVFRARDTTTGETVAVKLLHRVLTASVTAARFQREIQHLGRLRHPNILPLLDFGQDGDQLFFTMPFIEGDTLRVRLNRVGPMELGAVSAIVTQLASALDYAHAQNVVHRDLKPENVLFAGDRVLLCDFGVSRAIVASSEDALSSSGIAVGTPTYMSPEQSLRVDTIDGRTDIYALGCVTYEMLTGDPPFTGANLMTLMARHASQVPLPIRSVRPDIPAHVEAAISASLAKDARERPGSATAWVARLCGS
jgi:serine/threonine-protein kinase